MSDLIRGSNRSEPVPQLAVLARRLPREARERITDELVEGYVSAARVQAAGWVGSVGINQIAMLEGLEARQAATSPIRADLYAALVDDVALVTRQAIRRLGSRP